MPTPFRNKLQNAIFQQTRQDGWTPLVMAAYSGQTASVLALLEAGADKGKATTKSAGGVPSGSTALAAAQKKGHAEVAALLV